MVPGKKNPRKKDSRENGPGKLVLGKMVPEKLVIGKMVPGKIGPRKNVLQKLSCVKKMLGNLNDFFIFIDWFHYTHTKLFYVHLTILHAPNRRILKESRKVCLGLGFGFS